MASTQDSCHKDASFNHPFSNSLIIHQEKTKKITTETVVWICDPNYHKILPTLALNFSKNKMPAILALRVMLGLIHLFQLYASPIDKTILANGIV